MHINRGYMLVVMDKLEQDIKAKEFDQGHNGAKVNIALGFEEVYVLIKALDGTFSKLDKESEEKVNSNLMRNICDVLAEDLGTPCDNVEIENFMNDNCSEWCSENCSANEIDNKWKCWEKYLKTRCVQESEE